MNHVLVFMFVKLCNLECDPQAAIFPLSVNHVNHTDFGELRKCFPYHCNQHYFSVNMPVTNRFTGFFHSKSGLKDLFCALCHPIRHSDDITSSYFFNRITDKLPCDQNRHSCGEVLDSILVLIFLYAQKA